MTLVTVESCTAGSLVHLLSQAAGASETLHGGFVVYTKENKIKAIGVPQELLKRHTAVSAEVMAAGSLVRCPATLVAAITGVAPDPRGRQSGRACLRRPGRPRRPQARGPA